MKIIEPSFEVETPLTDFDVINILRGIERAARTSYKSPMCAEIGDTIAFLRKIFKHQPVFELGPDLTIRFICDRGVSHELVRHRLVSFVQESTRYCNYSQEKFGNEITVIHPCFWPASADSLLYASWFSACCAAEMRYFDLLKMGATAQQARTVLPNSLKTEIVMKANLREWRHILKERTSKAAHPQMRQLMIPLLKLLKTKIPVVFEDITAEE